MENIKKEEYVHLGCRDIRRDFWLDEQSVIADHNYPKSAGGIWTSKKNPHTACDWMEYEMEQSSFYTKYSYYAPIDACLIKLKDTAKVLMLYTKEDFENLKKLGLTIKLDTPIERMGLMDYVYIYELPDYDKIAEKYDAILVNPWIDESLYTYSVVTMYIMNPDAIDYYKPASIDLASMKLETDNEERKIKPLSSSYFELVSDIERLFTEINASNYKEYLDKLIKVRKELVDKVTTDETFKKRVENPEFSYRVLKTIVFNIAAKKYKEKKKELVLK